MTDDPIGKLRNAAQRELARIARAVGGDIGIAARHLGNGLALDLDGAGRYPLESTIKIAIALAVFDRVDRGEIALTDMVDIGFHEFNSGGPLADEFLHPGLSLSVLNLMEPMITRSCNSSTDIMIRVAGGLPRVEAYIRRLGFPDFEARHSMREALCIMHGLPVPPDDVSERDALKGQPFEVLDARNRTHGSGASYANEKRDQWTPAGMLRLLEAIWNDDGVISAPHRRLLLEIMGRTTTSPDRIKGRLPWGVAFASKTGSGLGAAADVGYLTLPDDAGTVALAIYVKNSRIEMAARNRVIADAARLVYDYFLLTAAIAGGDSA